jgi:hypothetical protein
MDRQSRQILEEIKRLQYVNSMRGKELAKLNERFKEFPNDILTNRIDFIRLEILENKRRIKELQGNID